jgi:NAD-dependent SIR2 family protein deacetylase
MTRFKAVGGGVTTAMKLQALVEEKKEERRREKEEALRAQVLLRAQASERRRAQADARRGAAILLQQHWRTRTHTRRLRDLHAAAQQAALLAKEMAKAEREAQEAAALARDDALPASGQVQWHGLLGRASWPPPRLVAPSAELARPGFSRASASEYVDEDAVLREKVFVVAALIRRAERCVVYSGAGMSTASGVPDLASKARASIAPHLAAQHQVSTSTPDAEVGSADIRWQRGGGGVAWAKGAHGGAVNRLDAKPSHAHRILASMERVGLVHHCVTLNHDRLAQKAGFPQDRLTEVAGAWGDDYNPVVPLDKPSDCGGAFRPDLLDAVHVEAERADCVLAVGTSLPGICSDALAEAATSQPDSDGDRHLVLVNLQETRMDARCAVRVWGLCDDFFALLARELRIPMPDRVCHERGKRWVDEHPRCRYRTPRPRAASPCPIMRS